MRLLPIILLFVLFSAEKCEDVSTEEFQNPAKTLIKMEKSGCFGTCPIYAFEINGEGMAKYHGTRFVEKMGDFTKQFPPKQINALVKIFEEAGLWDYKDEYTADVTDLPTTFLSFSHNGKTKKIRMYYEVPRELIDLSKIVESFANSADWESQILK